MSPLQLSRVRDSFHKFQTWLDGHNDILKLITPYLQLRFPWTTNAIGVSEDGQGGECAVRTNFQILLLWDTLSFFQRKHNELFNINSLAALLYRLAT